MSYATVAELKVWITSNGDLDTVDDVGLQLALDAAEAQINSFCGRSFAAETAATKFYYPASPDIVNVVDLVTVTSIASDNHGDRTFATIFAVTDYELLPYVDESGITAVRFDQVHIWPTSSKAFTPGYQVRIIGDFGYTVGAAAPADIRQAELIQAARLWKRRETPLGILSTDIGVAPARVGAADPDVQALLSNYSRSSASSWVLV